MKKKQMTKRVYRKKPCKLCREKVTEADYKQTDLLKRYISDRGKIVPSRVSGNCQKHQRLVANLVKRARVAGLLPFVKQKQGAQRERNSYSRR